ncbi:MAG: hypothetical protein ACRDAS_07080 [Cetobacterium sp.]
MSVVAGKRITLKTNKGSFVGGSASISQSNNTVSCDFGADIFYFTPSISQNTCSFIALIRI